MQINAYRPTEVKSLGPHADYDKNLSRAKEFITNIAKSLLPGMGVKLANPIRDDDGLSKYSVIEISWRTPRDAYLGNCCYPLSLHQDFGKFCLELERKFSEYHKAIKEYWATKNVKIESDPLPETAQKADYAATEALKWWDK